MTAKYFFNCSSFWYLLLNWLVARICNRSTNTKHYFKINEGIYMNTFNNIWLDINIRKDDIQRGLGTFSVSSLMYNMLVFSTFQTKCRIFLNKLSSRLRECQLHVHLCLWHSFVQYPQHYVTVFCLHLFISILTGFSWRVRAASMFFRLSSS